MLKTLAKNILAGVCILGLLGIGNSVFSQGGKKKNPQKRAKEHMLYEEYEQAIPVLKELLQQDPNSAYYNFWMGKSLYLTYKKNSALGFLDKVNKINPEVDEEFHYYYGLTLHYNLLFDQAIEQYKLDLPRYKATSAEYMWVANRISQCVYARKAVTRKDASKVKIRNMGEKINTPYAEHSPVISANDSILVFTARRPESLGAKPEQNYFDEDVYVSFNQGSDEAWSESQNIGTPVNGKGHDATIALTTDAKKLYIYRHRKDGGIFVTKFDSLGKKWKEPMPVGKPFNSKYYEACVAESPDGNTLFFTSDRPGGFGGRDIYRVRREGNKYSDPENLGPHVNTPFDEDAPYMHPDGKTLYYSSNGPNSLGGFDIFVTEWDSAANAWLSPINMGAPVNTTDDDIYFVVSASGENGYYSSGKEGGYGEKDIYQIKFPYFPYPRRYFIVELAGLIQDVESLEMIADAKIILRDKATGTILDSIITLSTDTNSFYFLLEGNKSYNLEVVAEGYLPVSDLLSTPTPEEEDIFIEKNFLLARPKETITTTPPGPLAGVEIMNVYFDFDKHDLRLQSVQEIDGLLEVLKENPELSVKIVGHTDWYGTYDYNAKLSEKRSTSVQRYLLAGGLSPEKIRFEYLSESKPIETNENDEGRQYNRRSELRLYKGDALVLASQKLKTGVESIKVDHTIPKGKPGFDGPGSQPTVTGYEDPNQGDLNGTGFDAKNNNADNPNGNTPAIAGLEGDVLHHIYFDFDKWGLRSQSKDELKKIKRVLELNPGMTIEIAGHTDAYGSVDYNQALSENRCNEAYQWLSDNGVNATLMVRTGFSELNPLAKNDNAQGRQTNRRVEFRLMKNGHIVYQSQP